MVFLGFATIAFLMNITWAVMLALAAMVAFSLVGFAEYRRSYGCYVPAGLPPQPASGFESLTSRNRRF